MINTTNLALALAQLENKQDLSGTLLISHDGQVLFEKAYGLASKQLSVPNTLATKFHIASVTKMFTAMAVLVLSEQGFLSLQDRPSRYLPELAALNQGITLHHLLSHTSGLSDIYDVPNLRFEMQKLNNEGGDLLSYLLTMPQQFPAGERWNYSSTNYILLGYLLERVTGISFDTLMKRYVLTPLGMTNTGLDIPRRINVEHAIGHSVQNGETVHADHDELSLFETAPGELYSTILDLKMWCDAMFMCPLVSPHTLQLMFTPHAHIADLWGRPWQYGYGWFLDRRFRMHGGRTPGFRSMIRQYPAQQVSIIVLLNTESEDPNTIIRAIEPLLSN